jgi:hypothetical protein
LARNNSGSVIVASVNRSRPRRQHLIQCLVIPRHQHAAGRSDVQGKHLAEVHFATDRMTRLGNGDTHPERALSAKQARRLAARITH